MIKEKIILLLQNRYTGPLWLNCYTHGVLKPIIDAIGGEEAYIRIQSDPKIYDSWQSSSNYKINEKFVQEQLNKIKPDYIIACGKAAKEVLEGLEDNYKVFFMPHPAWRDFNKNMQIIASKAIKKRMTGKLEDLI